MNNFLEDNSFNTIKILNNNSFQCENTAICGTRGWVKDPTTKKEDEKVYNRECLRLEMSLNEGLKHSLPITCFLHYPPIYENYEATAIIELLQKYNVKKCFYGHLHYASFQKAFIGERYGIEFMLVSSDYVEFTPYLI
jgi:predicted phosphohydrolase